MPSTALCVTLEGPNTPCTLRQVLDPDTRAFKRGKETAFCYKAQPLLGELTRVHVELQLDKQGADAA